jgi:hypothetical protein
MVHLDAHFFYVARFAAKGCERVLAVFWHRLLVAEPRLSSSEKLRRHKRPLWDIARVAFCKNYHKPNKPELLKIFNSTLRFMMSLSNLDK